MNTGTRKAIGPGLQHPDHPVTSALSQAPTPPCLSGISRNNPYYNILSTVCTHLAVYYYILRSFRHNQGLNKCVECMNRIFWHYYDQ